MNTKATHAKPEPVANGAPSSEPPKVETPQVNTETGEMTAPTNQSVTMLKKIVAKEVVGRPKLIYRKKMIKDADGKDTDKYEPLLPRPLYIVFGQARDTKTGESDFGPYIIFLGSFEAIELDSGERFVSDKLILQNPAEGLLNDELARRENKSDSIEFSFEVGVKPSQKWMETDAGNSYEFTIKAHFESTKADPLEKMRNRLTSTLSGKHKALAAPK